MSEIYWEKNAIDFLKKLQKEESERIIKKMELIKLDAKHYIEGLAGREEKKIRIGDYRLFVEYYENKDELIVLAIRHRKNAYKK